MTTTTAQTSRPAPEQSLDPRLRRLTIAVVTGAIMTMLDATIVNVALTTLGRDFHASLSAIQWVITAYLLALSMTIPITGWAIRRFGARNLWFVSLGLFIAGSVLCGLAWSVGSLILFRVLQGLGGGMVVPVGQTMLARAAGPGRMGRVMAVMAVPAQLAPVLGPVIGGVIVEDLAWRWLFYVNVPICAAALALAVVWLPRDADRTPGARLDLFGLTLVSPGLAALVFGLSQTGQGFGVTDVRVYGWAAAGLAMVATYVVYALRRAGGTLLNLGLFARRTFAAATATNFLYAAALFGVIVLLPLYFQIGHGDSPLRAGLMTAPYGLGAMASMWWSGRVTDRRGPRGILLGGIAAVAATLVMYTRLDVDTRSMLLIGTAFVVGLGHGVVMPPMLAAVYQNVEPAEAPSATSAANILNRVGSSFGTAVLAVVLQLNIRAQIPGASGSLAEASEMRDPAAIRQLVHAFGNTFWWTVGIALVSLVPALLIPRVRVQART